MEQPKIVCGKKLYISSHIDYDNAFRCFSGSTALKISNSKDIFGVYNSGNELLGWISNSDAGLSWDIGLSTGQKMRVLKSFCDFLFQKNNINSLTATTKEDSEHNICEKLGFNLGRILAKNTRQYRCTKEQFYTKFPEFILPSNRTILNSGPKLNSENSESVCENL